MSISTIDEAVQSSTGANRIARKLWREVLRPFRQTLKYSAGGSRATVASSPFAPSSNAAAASIVAAPPEGEPMPYLTGSGAGIAGFHPQQATVEAEAIPLIQRLVRQSRKSPGPIVEIGTLLGVTTTNMALVKAAWQKIITVDNYCWNPWGLSPDVHSALTAQVLCYLVQAGHVERLRMGKDEFYRTYQGPPPSLVFLDAWHDYEETKKDIQWAMRAGAKTIAGHDYCDEFSGVKQVVDEFGGPRKLCGTVWVL